ncbi:MULTISPECIES: hypothetical protein [Luteibacter]|uniref:hypothetical protein n=1 Tax=Luteibacter TaxID=242605 RepID=UPI0009DCD5B5|nr:MULTISPECIES: hypothetical protein [unclassified Luteibacter]
MDRRDKAVDDTIPRAQWINAREAMYHFATFDGATQSQMHIKPLHWYVACRLVVEGGFHPDDIMPRPPFRVKTVGGKNFLEFDPDLGGNGERTILGGLKTKNVDVVVTKDGIGPVVAVSCKGMQGAFRNLTNRMEETIGECTNLHITYPALVFGYMFVIRANRVTADVTSDAFDEHAAPVKQLKMNDIAVREGGAPVESILRFHSALSELTGRRGIREDVSRYEAVSLALVSPDEPEAGSPSLDFPHATSPLRFEQFFSNLYLRYEERFLLGAPDLKSVTRRLQWEADSSAFASSLLQPFNSIPDLDYEPRIRMGDAGSILVPRIVAATNRHAS